MADALSGLRVVDFSRVLAGPFGTMLLADFGAHVTKVERPGTGDDTRSWGPPFGPDGQATYFQAINRNKASVVLDLHDPEDAAHALTLAAGADVVVENFRPGLMERFGLGYDDVRARNPGVVFCSITGFGRGTGAALPGYDLLVQALSGFMSVTGDPAGEPQKAGVAVVDVMAGLFATVGILTALRHREATGEGQRVEVDLLRSALAGLVNLSAEFTVAGVVPERMGNAHPSIAPYTLLPCAEGELIVAVGTDRQFASLCTILGDAGLADDPRFASNRARVEHRDALRDALVRRLAARPATEWARALTEARVPAGLVNDLAGGFALAMELGLDPIVELPHRDGSAVPLPRNPIGLSATPATYRSAPPAMGEDPTGPAPAR